MFKKLLIASVIMTTASSIVCAAGAAAPYLGISVGLVNITSEAHPAYRAFDGNFFVGYGGIVSPNVNLAGEFAYTPASGIISGRDLLKTNWDLGFSLLPGYYFSERTLAFLRVGLADTRFSMNKGINRIGGQLGFGMQTNICQNWDLRAEYIWTKYQNVKNITSPNSDKFNLGLVYKFE